MIHGVGGIGKTRLALKFVLDNENQFPGGIFWLNAENEEQRTNQFYRILELIEPPSSRLAPLEDLLKENRDVLGMLTQSVKRYQKGQKCLWVLDNLSEASSLGQVINHEDWVPLINNLSVLITSRRIVSTVKPIPIGPLDEQSACNLLVHNLTEKPTENDIKCANRIAEWVGYLPLALELIGASISDTDYALCEWDNLSQKPADVTDETEKMRKALKEADNPLPLRGVIEAYQRSYQLLSDEARALARALAQLGPQPIPKEITNELKEIDTRNAVRMLQNRSFLTGFDKLFVGSMHRILADFIRHVSTEEEKNTAREQVRDALLKMMPWEKCKNLKDPYFFKLYHPHTIAWWKNGKRKNENHICNDENDIFVGARAGQIFFIQGLYEEAQNYQQQAYDEYCRICDNEEDETIENKTILLTNLALTLCEQKKYAKARIYQEEILRIRRKMFPNSKYVIVALNNLAKTAYAQNDIEYAINLQSQTFDMIKDLLNDNVADPEILLASQNCTFQVYYTSGQYEIADQYYREIISVYRKNPSFFNEGFFVTLHNFSLNLIVQEKLQEAMIYAQESYDGLRNLSESHPYTIKARKLVDDLRTRLSATQDSPDPQPPTPKP